MGPKRMPKFDPQQLTATQVLRVYALSRHQEGDADGEATGPERYYQGGFKRVRVRGMWLVFRQFGECVLTARWLCMQERQQREKEGPPRSRRVRKGACQWRTHLMCKRVRSPVRQLRNKVGV